jgi:hypothetical protein
MEKNPFAPPTTQADDVTGGGLAFSPEGAAVVSSLSRWMRFLGIVYYIGAGLMVLGGAITALSGSGMGFGVGLVLVVVAVVIGLAGNWLSSAGSDFERGIMSHDETPIGSGFRSLRAYLILMGILGIIGLINQAVQSLGGP